jgi:hypothetical protein
MSTVCINAATRIIDLIESLRLCGQLALFSIVDIHSCSSAVMVLILSSVTCPSPETRHKIEIALRCLRHIAAGSRSARNGLRLIEKFQSLVDIITARLCPRKILKADTNSGSEYDHASAASASENGFQNAPDHSFSTGLDGEELHAITDTIHTYGLQESASEWPGSDAEGAPQTSFHSTSQVQTSYCPSSNTAMKIWLCTASLASPPVWTTKSEPRDVPEAMYGQTFDNV